MVKTRKSPIQQPPNTVPSVLQSTYTVCHYSPQGNIVGQIGEKWRGRKVVISIMRFLSRFLFCAKIGALNSAQACQNSRNLSALFQKLRLFLLI